MMLWGARNLRVYASTKPADMRKSFNTRCRLVVDEFHVRNVFTKLEIKSRKDLRGIREILRRPKSVA